MTKHPVCTAPTMVCAYCQSAQRFSTRPQKLDNEISPCGPIEYPAGCCIQALVATMKYPDSHEPKKTRNAPHHCPTPPTLFSPNKNNPRKLDSKNNEKI